MSLGKTKFATIVLAAFAVSAALAALLLISLPSGASAATYYVNSSTGNDTTGNGSSSTPFKTFTKAYASSTNNDTIDLTGTFDWSQPDETGDASFSGFTISKNLTIRGQGATSTFIQASSTYNTADRSVFTTIANVTFQDVTIRYGKITGVTSTRGGGITNSGGTLIIRRTVVSNNILVGAANTTIYSAGGIGNAQSASTVIASSTVSDNSVTAWLYAAGGVYSTQTGNITIVDSTLSGNTATATAPNAFPWSYAMPAGAVGIFRSTPLTITNSTIANNSTNSYGGAVSTSQGVAHITNSTIVNNTAGYGAGGILWYSNSGGTKMHLKNNIVINNVASGTIASDFHMTSDSISTSTQSNGYNIVGTSTNYTFASAGDMMGAQPSLNLDSGLSSNGYDGPQTIALLSGSIAINAGSSSVNNNISIPGNDQRGIARVGAVDIGAYEFDGVNAPDTTPPSISSVASSTGTTTATITWTTNESATSTVRYGTTSSYGSASSTSAAATSHSFTLTGLTPSTSYHFQVESADSAGNKATSSDLMFTTAAVPDTIAPSILSVASSTTDTTAVISWITNEAATSSLSYGTTSSYGLFASLSVATTTHSYSLTGLASSTLYRFMIGARDAAGNVATSSELTFTTTASTTTATTTSSSSPNETSASTQVASVPGALTAISSAGGQYAACQDRALFNAYIGTRCSSSQAVPILPAPAAIQTPAAAVSAQLISNLQIGSIGNQVKLLQRYLNANGFTVSASGPGSRGNETTLFGGATRAALVKFQKAKGITPAVGYFGPVTRAYVLKGY